jgi:hypothetical protein
VFVVRSGCSTPPKWRPLGALAIFFLSAGLAACSDGGDATDAAPTTEAGTPSTEVGDPGPLARYRDYKTVSYADPAHWLCTPANEAPCYDNLDATVVNADGTTAIEKFEPAEDPAVDCFYVYPTISKDQTLSSDFDAAEDQELLAARHQVARLGSVCRVFAPVYRQVTLSGLFQARSDPADADAFTKARDTAYGDVLDAFKTYMAEDNEGRPFVLIGHSQGSGILNRLIASEVDPNQDVRDLMLSAFLAGSSVAVPEGKTVGGDFKNVPLCSAADEVGCVYTWASFRSTSPPPANSLFGRPRSGEGVAGCASPASPAGGKAPADSYFASSRLSSIVAADRQGDGSVWLDGNTPIETPFVKVPGLVDVECTSDDTFNWLAVTVNADPADPRADDIGGDLSPDWGLHLIDVDLVMGNIVSLVSDQIAARD